jgi:hypothetical protein
MKTPRLALLILITCSCSCAVDRWFFSGLTASKWIGLPQYEQAMAELRAESAKWGVAAVVLGVAAFLLALPRWPARPAKDATRPALTSGGPLGRHPQNVFASMPFSRWHGRHRGVRTGGNHAACRRIVQVTAKVW